MHCAHVILLFQGETGRPGDEGERGEKGSEVRIWISFYYDVNEPLQSTQSEIVDVDQAAEHVLFYYFSLKKTLVGTESIGPHHHHHSSWDVKEYDILKSIE